MRLRQRGRRGGWRTSLKIGRRDLTEILDVSSWQGPASRFGWSPGTPARESPLLAWPGLACSLVSLAGPPAPQHGRDCGCSWDLSCGVGKGQPGPAHPVGRREGASQPVPVPGTAGSPLPALTPPADPCVSVSLETMRPPAASQGAGVVRRANVPPAAQGGEHAAPPHSPRCDPGPLPSRNRSPSRRSAASRGSVSPLVKAAATPPTCLGLFRGGTEDTPLSLVNPAPRFLSCIRSGPGRSALRIAGQTWAQLLLQGFALCSFWNLLPSPLEWLLPSLQRQK